MADKQQNPAGEDQPATPDEQPHATSGPADGAGSVQPARPSGDVSDAGDVDGSGSGKAGESADGAKATGSASTAKATRAGKATKNTKTTKAAAKKTTAKAVGAQKSTSKAVRSSDKPSPRPAKKANKATRPPQTLQTSETEPDRDQSAGSEAARTEVPSPAGAAEPPAMGTPTHAQPNQAAAKSAEMAAAPSAEPPPAEPPPAEPPSAEPPSAEPPSAQPPPAAPIVPEAAPPAPGAWMEAAWDSVWHADEPPQRLAELTVAELGPRAAAWVAWLRESYPAASADGMVRLATQQARRHGWTLAAVDAAGPLAAAVHMPASAGVRAMLVLRIAAAYGHDPASPARVPELLTLLGYDGQESSPLGRWGPAWYVMTRLGRRRPTPSGLLRLLSAVSDQRDSLLRLAHEVARHYRSRGPETGTTEGAAKDVG